MSRRKSAKAPTVTALKEKVQEDPPVPAVKDDYSPIDELLAPEVVVQIIVLGISLHLAFEKFGGFDSPSIAHFQNFGIVLIVILVGAYSRYKAGGKNRALLPKFEEIYGVYLPFMLCFLFDDRLTLINCALILNCVEIGLPFRIPMQWILTLLQSMEASTEDKLRGLYAISINYGFSVALAKVSELKSLDPLDCNLFSILLTNVLFLIESDSIYFHVLKYTLMAFLLTVGFNYVISYPLTYFSSGYLRSIILFTNFVVGVPFLIKKLLVIENEDPLNWLIEYIMSSKTRKSILVTWLASLLVLIPNVLIFKSNFSLNTSRKVWHFLILLLISQPFVQDPEFVKISLAGTVVLFLSVEYLRYLKLQPFGEYIDSKLRLFADFRDDKGPIIISYIYLIIGVSAPLLISNSPVGLISLGVGDSLASIIGGKWGKHFWSGTSKTIEGTLAFIVSTSLTTRFFKEYMGYFQAISQTNLYIVCILSGLLEGNSPVNDNILIPAFMLIIEKIFCE